ncbi:MAG: polysaccharide biosynthesis tyrosine autokinase, partial [Planctomycetaceae bacterium]|nr:polysaccharide biosynthesis tyrosine autokinase [Planctomycetaceae bacterium]
NMLTAQKDALQADLEAQRIEAKSIGVSSFELESLKNEIEQIDKIGQTMADEIQRLTIELQSPIRITMFREAAVPPLPDTSKKYKLTALSGFGLCGLVIAGIIFLEIHAHRISSAQDVVSGLGLRMLGSLPIMPQWMTSAKRKSGGASGKRAVMRSIWTESIDSARTMILRDAGSQDSCKVIMIVSAMGGEGKTTLSSHLATSLARAGRKTLLVDTDMRRPSVSRVFGLELTPGFCEIVRGDASMEEAVRPSSTEGLSLLPAGKVNQATLKLLASDHPAKVFAVFRSRYDIIIVDSAPILPVTDSLLIGQHVDAALFSIRRDVSRMGKVAAACQRLNMLGIPLLGAITIGLDEGAYGSRYGYSYYGAGYPGYGYYLQPELLKRV